MTRDNVGECCGNDATVAIGENTSSTGLRASISFHNANEAEGQIRLIQNTINGVTSRRFQMFDNQGQGMGLELTGRLWYGNSGSRTETRSNAGLQGNAGAQSGFYETENPVNFPSGASSWWHLIDCRHSNPNNNYALQIAGSFYDQKLYFRKTNNNPSQQWTEILTTSAYANNITYDYSTASMTAPNGSMSVIPGLTRTLSLKAGDIIYIDAQGGVMAAGANWACVEVGIKVNGTDLANGGYTKTCVDWQVGYIAFTNWAVSGHYVVPSNGNYTIAVYAGRYGGSGDAIVGGDGTTVTQGVMRIEKITQNY